MNYSVMITKTQKYFVEVASVDRHSALLQAEALVADKPSEYETESESVSVVRNQCGAGYEWRTTDRVCGGYWRDSRA
jgi:hypothetical protein